MTRFAIKDVPFEFTEKEVIYVCGNFKGSRRQLFRIQFAKDGSIYIQLPYFNDSRGVLGYITRDPSQEYPASHQLENGKVTTERVKYTHHPDGEAHFSQDGKVLTEIRRKACPFDEVQGQLFSLMFRGFESFKEIKDWSKVKRKKNQVHLGFDIAHADSEIRLCNVVGMIESFDNLCKQTYQQFGKTRNKIHGVTLTGPDGRTMDFRVIRNPFSLRKDQVLLIGMQILDADSKEPWLSFLGGFDPESVMLNHDMESSFLCLSYGRLDQFDDLEKSLGSIDFKADRARRSLRVES